MTTLHILLKINEKKYIIKLLPLHQYFFVKLFLHRNNRFKHYDKTIFQSGKGKKNKKLPIQPLIYSH